MQAIADLQLQELQQARDRVFQAAIRREARQVAALIAAAPPLVPSASDPGLSDTALNGTNPPDLTEDGEEEMSGEEEGGETKVEEEDKGANERDFQASIQKEARMVAALIAAAPPLTTSSPAVVFNEPSSISGTNPPELREDEEEEMTEGEEEEMKVEEDNEEFKKEEKDEDMNEEDRGQTAIQEATQQARDGDFQARIQKEARMVAALIAASPPLATSSPALISDDTSSTATPTELMEELEEKEDMTQEDEIGHTDLEIEEATQQARNQALMQEEARMVPEIIAEAPPLVPSPIRVLNSVSASSGTNPAGLMEESDGSDAGGKEEDGDKKEPTEEEKKEEEEKGEEKGDDEKKMSTEEQATKKLPATSANKVNVVYMQL